MILDSEYCVLSDSIIDFEAGLHRNNRTPKRFQEQLWINVYTTAEWMPELVNSNQCIMKSAATPADATPYKGSTPLVKDEAHGPNQSDHHYSDGLTIVHYTVPAVNNVKRENQ